MLPARNFYITDHQGNIAGVYNTRTDSLEQRTGYYPYGLPHASASENGGPETNRRKFGAKELTADLGLNLYDFAARWHNPAIPGFTTPDPLAEKYRDISPYVYCAADPINLIDPSGMTIDTTQMTPEQQTIWLANIQLAMRLYPLFGSLLKKLESSSKIYTIKLVDQISTASIENQNGQFIRSDDNSGGTIFFNINKFTSPNIPIEVMTEEMFHAFQSEMGYIEEIFNVEFEARVFVKFVTTDVLSISGSGDSTPLEIMSEIASGRFSYYGIKTVDNKGIRSTRFMDSYMRDAMKYALFHIIAGTKNAKYKAPTLVYPRALYMFDY